MLEFIRVHLLMVDMPPGPSADSVLTQPQYITAGPRRTVTLQGS